MSETISIKVYGLIEHNGNLLLVEDREGKPGWKLPGGHREVGENLLEALQREVREEVGIHIDSWKIFQVKDFFRKSPEGYHIRLFYSCATKDFTLQVDSREIAKATWFSSEEVKRMSDSELYEDHRETIKKYSAQ